MAHRTNAQDIAQYIRRHTTVYGETHLHKLVYYAQCWSLAWDGKPLFDDEIQAWKNGPVLPSLRGCMDGPLLSDDAHVGERDRATADAVIEFFDGMNGSDLSELSHERRPWIEARGSLAPESPSTRAIDLQVMREWASEETLSGHPVPKRRAMPHAEADPAKATELARRAASRWAHTLEILAS